MVERGKKAKFSQETNIKLKGNLVAICKPPVKKQQIFDMVKGNKVWK